MPRVISEKKNRKEFLENFKNQFDLQAVEGVDPSLQFGQSEFELYAHCLASVHMMMSASSIMKLYKLVGKMWLRMHKK